MMKHALMVASMTALTAYAGAAPLNYSQNFDALADNATSVPGWSFAGTGLGLTIRAEADTANKVGQNSLLLLDTESSLGNNLQASYSLGTNTIVTASFDLWAGDDFVTWPATTTEFSVMLMSGTNELGRLDINHASGASVLTMKARFSASTQTTLGSYNFDTRIPITMTADASTDKWSVSVNGASAVAGNFRNDFNAASIDTFTFRYQGATGAKMGEYYVDNVTLVPEPAMLGLAGLTGLLAMRKRPA